MSYRYILFVFLLLILSTNLMAKESLLEVYGWIEDIYIAPWKIAVEAKLDSGAKTSSMQAEEVKEFKKDGDKWVSFLLEVRDERTDQLERETIKRKVVREVEIKRHGQDSQHRYVVLMEICLDKELHELEFTLTDRDKYHYPVLLGREFMDDKLVIDPGKIHVSKPDCDL